MTTRVEQAASKKKGHRWFAALFDPLNRITGTERHLAKYRPYVTGEAEGRVLEVGAGTGASFAYYKGSAQVVATEPDPFMVAEAERRLNELALKNIEIRQAVAEDLPFDDDSFDYVVSTMVFCTVGDPGRALAEVNRVLKPGGTFRFIEHVRPVGGVKARLFDAINPVWGWFGAGCQLNRRTLETINDAGFEIAELRREKMGGFPVIVGVAKSTGVPSV